MNLVIDVGNTSVKLAVFEQDEILFKKSIDQLFFTDNFLEIIKNYSGIQKAIVSSVGNFAKDNITLVEKYISVLELDSHTAVPFKNDYKTPKTLGVDRIALVCAAIKKFPKKDVLIIDAGTCITYEFLTKKGVYLGGAISPGITTRYRSLNNLTAKLPLLERKIPEALIGNSSKESIHSGVIHGVLMEIDGIIQQYAEDYADLTVILTGGDADFLSKQLKNSIFANSNFLLEGLNFILDFNSNE